MSWLNLDRRKAQLVAARDLRDAISELRLILAMVGLTIAIPLACAIGVRGLALYGGGTSVVNRLSVVGAFFVVFIPASFSLVLALESFVGERERTTLEVLISTPLKEAEIYAARSRRSWRSRSRSVTAGLRSTASPSFPALATSRSTC